MIRPRFDKAFECLVSVIMSEFVVRHKVDAQRFSLYAKTHTHACTHMHTEFALSSNANAHLLDRPVKTDMIAAIAACLRLRACDTERNCVQDALGNLEF